MKSSLLLRLVAVLVWSAPIAKNIYSQVPGWSWAKNGSGPGGEIVRGITADAAGNAYIVGYFQGATISFGSVVLTNSSNMDMFVVKYDPNGNVLWAKNTVGYAEASAVVVDQLGYIYIAGNFFGQTATFGSTTLNNPGGNPQVFIAKYDQSGNPIWAKGGGGIMMDYAKSLALDALGHFYIVGSFCSSTATFGSFTVSNSSWYSSHEIFIAKYDTAGNALWAKSAGGEYEDEALSVAVDQAGDAYVTGYCWSSSFTFGSGIITQPGTYVAKYDVSGNLVWLHNIGGTYRSSVAVDQGGYIYAAGDFQSASINVGSTTLVNNSYSGYPDSYLVKYDALGNIIWARSFGGLTNDVARSVTTDLSGNVYIGGYFDSQSFAFGSSTFSGNGYEAVFVVKFDANGNEIWGIQGGGSVDEILCMSISVLGDAYVAGWYQSSPFNLGSSSMNYMGSGDAFIAKLGGITGIEENLQCQLGVFPNPSSGIFTVSSGNVKGPFEIFDILGESIYSGKLNAGSCQIDLDSVVDGIYFFRLESEVGTVTKKIIIQR